MATTGGAGEEFELEEVHLIHALLRGLPQRIAVTGRGIQATGGVKEVSAVAAGTMYTATVSLVSAGDFPVRAALEPGKKWVLMCSCGNPSGCEHVAAVAWELLARHSGAVVNRLAQVAAARRNAEDPSSRGKKKGRKTSEEGAAAPKDADLSSEAKAYNRLLPRVQQRLWSQGYVTTADLARMGFSGPAGNESRSVDAWESLPQSMAEIREYLALWMKEKGWVVPADWVEPAVLEGRRRERDEKRRKQEMEKWRQRMQKVVASTLEATGVPTELRLAMDAESAVLQWRRGEAGEFVPLRPSEARELDGELEEDLDPQSATILSAMEDEWGNRVRLKLDYSSSRDLEVLHDLLSNPRLEHRLVNSSGDPLPRHAEKLRWELETPDRVAPMADGSPQYRLQLVYYDGSPVTELIFVTEGRPPVYFTERGIFNGPKKVLEDESSAASLTIPAYAIETADGVKFLRAASVAVPPNLERRLERRPVKFIVKGELGTEPFAKDREVCRLKLIAESDDGEVRMEWRHGGWHDARPGGRKKPDPVTSDGRLVWYDTVGLPNGGALLAGMSAEYAMAPGAWQFRVTRNFPEVFSAWLLRLPKETVVELRGELQSLLNPTVSGRVELSVEETEVDWFDLKVVVAVSDAEMTPEEIQMLLNARGKWVRLGEKGWKRLAFELSQDENEQLARLGLSAAQFSAEPQRLHALQLADTAAKRFLKAEQFERIERRASELLARVTPDVPKLVKAQLRPYQLEGFHFLAYLASNRFGGVLADDMGLGKTLQTLTWIAWLRAKTALESPQEPVRPCLVVCPKSVAHNWRAECERFVEGIRAKVWESGSIEGFKDSQDSADLHVLNYAQLRSLGDAVGEMRFLAVVLDEGQYIKNPGGITNNLVCRMQSQHRLILSGTPIENRLSDLWALMKFAMPGALGGRAEFGRLYDAKDDPLARRRLAARVRPFLLRRTKGQVARDLPDRIEEDSYSELEGEQLTLYKAELKRAQGILLGLKTAKDLQKTRFHLLTSLLRLRQICCDGRLLNPELKQTGAKLEALEELILPLMEQGEKVLIFSQFVEMLQLIRKSIQSKVPKIFYLAGETEDRGVLVDEFQSHSGAAVFLISLKAGGFGLNLTAASYVVLFDPWWNPAVENQAIDRTHRIGQTRKVIAYRLLIKGSIEEKIRALQTKKKALAEDVLGEEKFSQALTIDDLKYLFSDGGDDGVAGG